MKKALIILGSVLGLLLVVFLGASWYFSGVILDGLEVEPEIGTYDVTLTAVDGDSLAYTIDDPEVEDPATDDYSRSHTGLAFANGTYVLLSSASDTQDRTVTRDFELVAGPTPEAGATGRLDWYSHPDPAALGLDGEVVTYDAPLGPTPALVVAPEGKPNDTWAIVVHGLPGSRRTGLHMTPLLAERGITTMLINYRDDLGEPDVPHEDGIGNFGHTEWEDVQAAVDYAQEQGAQDIVLVGYSMGGAIVSAFMENSDEAGVVSATILDSPAVDFNKVVVYFAEQMGLPATPLAPVVWGAKQFTQMRANFDFASVNHVDDAAQWPVPALVLSAGKDDFVPIASIEEFAAALPDGEYVTFDDAAHIGEWNIDPEYYEQVVGTWLDENVG